MGPRKLDNFSHITLLVLQLKIFSVKRMEEWIECYNKYTKQSAAGQNTLEVVLRPLNRLSANVYHYSPFGSPHCRAYESIVIRYMEQEAWGDM